ncbi:helicase, partial [Acinetobacter baumannii]
STDIRETVGRYGRLVIERDEEGALVLRSTDPAVLGEVSRNKRISPLLIGHPTPDSYTVDAWARGHIKQELLKIGWPAEDLAGYTPGTPHPIDLAEDGWKLRPYQRQA